MFQVCTSFRLARHLEVGKFIVGSHYVHGCDHMNGQSLFHKIAKAGISKDFDGHNGQAIRCLEGAQQALV